MKIAFNKKNCVIMCTLQIAAWHFMVQRDNWNYIEYKNISLCGVYNTTVAMLIVQCCATAHKTEFLFFYTITIFVHARLTPSYF